MSNCVKHPDVAASAYCRTCGKALCSSCARDVRGVMYCEECLAARLGDTMPPRADNVPPGNYVPPPVAPTTNAHPGLAAILGFIPGVGAMYNGQFVKGFIHVMVFVTLIWLTDNASGLFGMGIAGWVAYMVFDAYQTAKALKYGLPLPDPFGLNNLTGGPVREAAYAQRMTEAGERIGEGFSHAATAFQRQGANPGNPTAGAQQYAPPPPPYVPPPRDPTPTGAVVLIVLGALFLLGNMGWSFHIHRWWPVLLIGLGVWLFVRRQQRLE
jgi:TM2 domain-containing membrane protein YozV